MLFQWRAKAGIPLCDAFTECNKVLGLMITQALKQEAARLFQGRRDKVRPKTVHEQY